MSEKFSAIILIVLGIFLLVCFYLLNKKQKITILREFMYQNVKKKQIKQFCIEMSYVFFFFGIGTLFMGISYFGGFTKYGGVVLGISIVIAAVQLKRMQIKYRFARAKK